MNAVLPRLRSALGAFRILRRRAEELRAPGLAVWTDAGEQSLTSAKTYVTRTAHADEVADLEAAREIREGIEGLKDGKVDTADLAHLERASRLVKRSADLAHDIGEVAS